MMKKILLCDDDGDIVTLMQIIIKGMGYQFASVERINDVKSLVEQENPDLVLMDLWIPDIGGEQAVKILKENNSTKDIPVLLFSASEKLVERATEIGADGCIQKPFDVRFLKDKIASMLQEKMGA